MKNQANFARLAEAHETALSRPALRLAKSPAAVSDHRPAEPGFIGARA